MFKWLGGRNSSPAMTISWSFFCGGPEFNSSASLVKIPTDCLLSVGFVAKFVSSVLFDLSSLKIPCLRGKG